MREENRKSKLILPIDKNPHHKMILVLSKDLTEQEQTEAIVFGLAKALEVGNVSWLQVRNGRQDSYYLPSLEELDAVDEMAA